MRDVQCVNKTALLPPLPLPLPLLPSPPFPVVWVVVFPGGIYELTQAPQGRDGSATDVMPAAKLRIQGEGTTHAHTHTPLFSSDSLTNSSSLSSSSSSSFPSPSSCSSSSYSSSSSSTSSSPSTSSFSLSSSSSSSSPSTPLSSSSSDLHRQMSRHSVPYRDPALNPQRTVYAMRMLAGIHDDRTRISLSHALYRVSIT